LEHTPQRASRAGGFDPSSQSDHGKKSTADGQETISAVTISVRGKQRRARHRPAWERAQPKGPGVPAGKALWCWEHRLFPVSPSKTHPI